jgi:hypothetical protein
MEKKMLSSEWTRQPNDLSKLHDVHENARKLAILYTIEVEVARLIGRWIPTIPNIDEKLLLGRLIFEDAEHAGWLEARLVELRVPETRLAAFRERTCPALKMLEETARPEDFLCALFRTVKPALMADYRRHLECCPPSVDEPSKRFLRQILAEEEDHVAAGLALLAERRIGWAESDAFQNEVRASLWDLGERDGRLSAGTFVGRSPIPQRRPIWPDNVDQLPADAPMPLYPGTFEGDMQRVAHDLVFSELEAEEIFARYVYEYPQCPWQFHRESARICWDEARHVELLLNVLARYGGYVGQFPAKAPGYEEFMSLESAVERLIMVSVIAEGEVSTDTQTQHREAFREMGDELSALLKDYEMADEVSHGRFGERWARQLAEMMGVDYGDAYERARVALNSFKAKHPEAEGDSRIPLVRLGGDEGGSRRRVNATAKRLLGYSEEQITRLVEESGGARIEDAAI